MLEAYRIRVEEEYQHYAAAEAEAVSAFIENKARVDANIATLE